MASTALRDPGVAVTPNAADHQTTSAQLTVMDEGTTYAGTSLPTTSGYAYRDIPDMTKDLDGTRGTTCRYALRPSSDCGTNQTTVAARIADCASANPTRSTWNGAVSCNGGEGSWRLVTRAGANTEVWQDQRTGLLWSSKIINGENWCQATGNTQDAPLMLRQAYNNTSATPITGNGTIGAFSGGTSSVGGTFTITFTGATTFTVSGTNCGGGAISAGGLTTTAGSTVTWSRANYCSFTITQGATNFVNNDRFVIYSTTAGASCTPGSARQPASPVSFCAEAAGLTGPTGETWGTGVYLASKGYMGANSSPSVRWRLPSASDYKLADVNGLRFVLPDTGIAGSSRAAADASPGGAGEWTAIRTMSDLNYALLYDTTTGTIGNWDVSWTNRVRCVGR